jgi:hypothetical protein
MTALQGFILGFAAGASLVALIWIWYVTKPEWPH